MNKLNPIKEFVVHMIGNAHIDPVWLWRWQEGYQVVRATFRSMLSLIEEFPEFIFTCSSAAFYEWIRNGDPEMFENIRRRVKEGRWNIVGGWWIEPDCNIPSGESFVRQGLYGQRYFNEKFGTMAKVGYNIDSFGHNGMLPQVLSKLGLKSYIFMRPSPNENKEIPDNVFWWESIDGSRVLTFRIPISYAASGDMEGHIRRIFKTLRPPLKDIMCFYGRGDHGGGPTKGDMVSIRRLREKEDRPEIVLSSPDLFFEKIRQQNLSLPVFRDEMQHHASGCYSVHSEVKRNNRKAENLLCTAEKFSVLADILFGKAYPWESLTRAWKNLLFTQFHDILAGTSIPEAYDDVRDIHGEVMHRANREINYAIQTLASNIRTMGGGTPIIVFNPHSWRVCTPVEVEGVNGEGGLQDEAGQSVPMQRIQPSASVGEWRQRIVFIADVPAFGYRVYHNVDSKPELESFKELVASENMLENEWIRLEIDPKRGHFRRVYDKKNGIDVFRGSACVPIVLRNFSDTWSHSVTSFRDENGVFEDAKVSLLECGPVRAVIRIESNYNNSLMRMRVCLYRDLPYIECRVSVNWQEKHKMLKLSFPIDIVQPTATYSIPYGYITRPCDGEEEPGQHWIDVTGQATNKEGEKLTYGLSLCNDCKYSYDIKGSDMRLTVLRSPPYAHHIPYGLEPNLTYQYIDQGWQDFNLFLLPHAGSWQDSGTVRLAEELNVKPMVIVDYAHEGELPTSKSFIETNKMNIIASALKRHEDSEDIILRCYETDGKETETKISLPLLNRKWKAKFKPCEIKTFLIPREFGLKVSEISLLELPIET